MTRASFLHRERHSSRASVTHTGKNRHAVWWPFHSRAPLRDEWQLERPCRSNIYELGVLFYWILKDWQETPGLYRFFLTTRPFPSRSRKEPSIPRSPSKASTEPVSRTGV